MDKKSGGVTVKSLGGQESDGVVVRIRGRSPTSEDLEGLLVTRTLHKLFNVQESPEGGTQGDQEKGMESQETGEASSSGEMANDPRKERKPQCKVGPSANPKTNSQKK